MDKLNKHRELILSVILLMMGLSIVGYIIPYGIAAQPFQIQQTVSHAIVYDVSYVQPSGLNLNMTFSIAFMVDGTIDFSDFTITVLPSDSAVQINNKITTAAIAEANRFGYTLTNGNIIFTPFRRGLI